MRIPGLVSILLLVLFAAFAGHGWAAPSSSATAIPSLHAPALSVKPVLGQHLRLQHLSADVRYRQGRSAVAGTSRTVSLTVTVGYDDQYRSGAWVPVRAKVQNLTSATISGTVEIPDAPTGSALGQVAPYKTAYDAPVVLPAGAAKLVTLFIPAAGVANQVVVRFISGGKTLAMRNDFPTTFGDSDFTLGILTRDPASAIWLKHVSWGPMTVDTVFLTPSTVDRLPQALATFDVIAISNVATSQLDTAQVEALRRYAVDGGSLLLMGGPDWQETLGPIQNRLVPGRLIGSRHLPNLSGLSQIGNVAREAGQGGAVVSYLRPTSGQVLSAQDGIPLVLRRETGAGIIEYLAFDPGLAPFPAQQTSTYLLSHLVALAAPDAARRAGLPYGSGPRIISGTTLAGGFDMGGELANVPAAALPSLFLFVILAVLYVLVLGPVNIYVLARLRKRELMWVTIPVLALLGVASTFFITMELRGKTILLNTVSVINLPGTAPDRSATLFVGLFAPVRGDYRLTYNGGAAAAELAPQSGTVQTGGGSRPVGLRIDEGTHTTVDFLAMNMWSMRNAILDASVPLSGRILSDLHPASDGDLVGTIRNDLTFSLRHAAVLAGTSVTHLPDIPPGAMIRVRVRPAVDTFDSPASLWQKVYGGPRLSTSWSSSQGGIPFFSPAPTPAPVTTALFGGSCCSGQSLAQERSLDDRIRNVASQLLSAEAPNLSRGSVELIAWTDQTVEPLAVDGAVPQRRDLSLILSPLGVHLSAGPFLLRPGTAGPHLVDMLPTAPTSCCTTDTQGIYLGPGGFATFQFDLPAGKDVRFRKVHLVVNTGGADGSGIGSVYDWNSHRWERVNLSTGSTTLFKPGRFVSHGGAMLLRLAPTDQSGDVSVNNPGQDLQVSGEGVAS